MNEKTPMEVALDRIERLVKERGKLERKVGRKAWHLNRARDKVARLQSGLREVRDYTEGHDDREGACQIIDRVLNGLEEGKAGGG